MEDVVENVFDVGNDHMLIIRHQICDYHWHACSSLSVLPTDVEDVVEFVVDVGNDMRIIKKNGW